MVKHVSRRQGWFVSDPAPAEFLGIQSCSCFRIKAGGFRTRWGKIPEQFALSSPHFNGFHDPRQGRLHAGIRDDLNHTELQRVNTATNERLCSILQTIAGGVHPARKEGRERIIRSLFPSSAWEGRCRVRRKKIHSRPSFHPCVTPTAAAWPSEPAASQSATCALAAAHRPRSCQRRCAPFPSPHRYTYH